MSAARQLLYTSRLVEPARADVFAAICRMARLRNPALGVSGVLLFDGQRFCQRLAGPPGALSVLMLSILRDPRHEQIVLLADEPMPERAASTKPWPSGWTSGYCESHEIDRFDGPPRLEGFAALDVMLDIVSRADLAP